MKYLVSIILVFHGLIHLMGFVKAFEIREIKELSLPISRQLGVLWLTAAVMIISFTLMYLLKSNYDWVLGIISLILSQFLIFLFWKDAKFGTLPNLLIIVISTLSLAYYLFNESVKKETQLILESGNIKSGKGYDENVLENLPKPVQRWLKNSGILAKPFIRTARIEQVAEMKMKPEQKNWMKAKALQYSNVDVPGFIWSVEVNMNPFLYFQGRDIFKDGKGQMKIKVNSLFKVVDEKGQKLDEGTIQRFLGEMVWMPSLAFSEYVSWEEISDSSALAVMEYMGAKGSGIFYFNSNGDFVKFSAMRYMGNEEKSKKYEWVLEVQGYKIFEGIRVPSKMTATWKLDEDWKWLKLEITDLKYNYS